MENLENSMDIFNLDSEALIKPTATKSNNFYQPAADEGRDGVYKAVIRFLPYHKNPNKSKIQKYYVWIQDEIAGENFSVDCPSTVGKKSILKDTYWKLFNSQSAAEKTLAEKFSRAENFYSLVQVIKDPNKPELEGKIMVFKFGKKINDKIEAQLKPLVGNPCNPYDLFEGKLFALHITKKQKWNNYDSCEFVGDKCALTVTGDKEPIKRNAEDMAKVVEWLKKESPELEKYEYKEWTDEVTAKVYTAIRNIIPDGRVVEGIINSAHSDRPTTGNVKAMEDVKDVSNMETGYEKTKETQKPTAKEGIDDLYAGL